LVTLFLYFGIKLSLIFTNQMVYTMYKFRYDFIHTMTKIQGGKLKNKSVFFFEGE